MKIHSRTDIAILMLIFAVGFSAVFALSNRLETAKPRLPEQYEDEDLSLQGERLKGYSFGFEGLVADWYWMRSLQYVGNKFLKSREKAISLDDLTPLNPRLLYPLLDNATSLDPQFMAAYTYGATVLPAIDADQAIAIVKKGIRNNPGEWRLYHYLGFIQWRLKRYDDAAKTYDEGSAIPGAPPFMKLMAARMRSDGGSHETARLIYQRIYDQADDSQTKENARLRLLQLDHFDILDAVTKVLKDFRSKTGRCPKDWREAIPMLSGVTLPRGLEFRMDDSGNLVDPSDAPYMLLQSDEGCNAALDPAKTKIPLK